MFKHILVPLDGSQLAEAALPVARFLADKLGAQVTLIHIIEKNAPQEVHGEPHLSGGHESNEYLCGIRRKIFADSDRVTCHVHTVAVDDVAAGIVAHHQEFDHDLIVMCSHGRGRALHLMLGSIAQKVIARGSIPVLITHPDEKENAPAFACSAIVVPLDGDAAHETALPVSAGLAGACTATLHLVQVVPDFHSLSGPKTVTSRLLPGTTTKMLEIEVEEGASYLREKQEWLANTVLRQAFMCCGAIRPMSSPRSRHSPASISLSWPPMANREWRASGPAAWPTRSAARAGPPCCWCRRKKQPRAISDNQTPAITPAEISFGALCLA